MSSKIPVKLSSEEDEQVDKLILFKSDSGYRWHILGLNCVLLFGTCYAVDIPAAVKSQMSSEMGSPDNFETMYSLLFTLYSLPNVFFPFFSGYFVNKMGTRYCLLAFTSLVLTGQVVFAIGMSLKSWPIMFLGRVLYGFGDASIYVTNSTFIAEYFGNGKELGFAYAFNLSTARIGSVVNNMMSPIFVSMGGVELALWAGAILMAVSVCSVLLMFPIDIYLENLIVKNSTIYMSTALLADTDTAKRLSSAEEEKEETDSLKLSDAVKLPRVFYILCSICLLVSAAIFCLNNIASSLLLERDYFKEPPSGCALDIPYKCQSSENSPVNCPSSTYYQPPLPVNISYDGDYYSELTWSDIDCTDSDWSDGCASDFCNRFDDAILLSNTVMSIPYSLTSVLLPLFGLYVDKYGKIGILLLISASICFVDHLLLALTTVNPIVLMSGQGIVYSVFSAAIWPSIPLIVPHKYLSLSFGIIFSAQSIGLTVIPLLLAEVYNRSDSKYIPNVELCLAFFALLGIIACLWVNYEDHAFLNNVLNNPPSQANTSVVSSTEATTNTPLLEDGDKKVVSADIVSADADSDAAKFESLFGNGIYGEVVTSPHVSIDKTGMRVRVNSRSERLSRVSKDDFVKEMISSNKV